MSRAIKIAACVKRVLDSTVPLHVADGAVQQDVPWPILHVAGGDRAALDQALELRGRVGGSVMAVSVGGAEAVGALRFCLARGADRALHVQRPDDLDPMGTAVAVARAFAREPIDLLLCGGRSGDGASGQFPAVLAAELDWPLVTGVVGVTVEGDRGLLVERRVERGDRETVRCPLPAVLAVEATCSEPRYVSVRARRRAGSLPIQEINGDGGGAPPWQLIALEAAKPRPRRVSGPDPKLSAMDRVAHLLSGGVKQKRSGEFVEGSPDSVAADIVRFLEERGFVSPREGRPGA